MAVQEPENDRNNLLVSELPLSMQFEFHKQANLIRGASREQLIELYEKLLAHHFYHKHTVSKVMKING